MNREILFRGKRIDTGEWIEGWYCKQVFSRWPLKSCIIPSQLAEAGEISHFAIIPETVGQFTGLTDKGGKRIFEGDIIAGKIGKFVIRWSEPICGFAAGEGLKMVPCMNQGTMKYCEVVGNIYDNPELLEVSDNG